MVTKINNTFLTKPRTSKKGFTLIESLAVIAIIGVLASLSIYVATTALQKGRDTRRKSDLAAVSLGFQARYEAKTCNNQQDVGIYPGGSLAVDSWQPFSLLRTYSDGCGSFSEYLSTIPVGQPYPAGQTFEYMFNLSDAPAEIGDAARKHYRLTAKLERDPSISQLEDLARSAYIWDNSFGGKPLPNLYNYLIGN